MIKRILILVMIINLTLGANAYATNSSTDYFKNQLEIISLVNNALLDITKTESYNKNQLSNAINSLMSSHKRSMSLNQYNSDVMRRQLEMETGMYITINEIYLINIESYKVIDSYCKDEISKEEANNRILENHKRNTGLQEKLLSQMNEYSIEMEKSANAIKEHKY